MAKFKKNFWSGSSPEPAWYAQEKDPLDRLGGFKGSGNSRPEGARIPKALVGGKEVTIKEAFDIYKLHHTESFRLPFPQFKTALINGSTFKTTKGVVSKP